MVKCSSCGKPIEKIPSWLADAKVEYVCDKCPNRTLQNIAFVQLETPPAETEDIFGDEDAAPAEPEA